MSKELADDRTFGGNELYVDLIPSTSWYSSARKFTDERDWEKLSKYIKERVHHKCECCGIVCKTNKNGKYIYRKIINNNEFWMECHERWEYNYETKTQILKRLIGICNFCHRATHMGKARIDSYREESKKHLQKVRNFSDTELENHINDAFRLFHERSQIKWKIDLSLITNFGIRIIKEHDSIEDNSDDETDKNINNIINEIENNKDFFEQDQLDNVIFNSDYDLIKFCLSLK